jgi:hypothetical protein
MSRPRVQSLIKLTYWTFSVGSKQRHFGESGNFTLFFHFWNFEGINDGNGT